ncbi:MAG: hypothetical protein ACREN5_00750 [Gemmatimonadales bacterium]
METESAPEFAAQFIFVMLLAGVMFALGFVFRPRSKRKRIRDAERVDW